MRVQSVFTWAKIAALVMFIVLGVVSAFTGKGPSIEDPLPLVDRFRRLTFPVF